jgi:predicted RNase H-like nuclease (RuvC/YqgF family)
VSAATHLLEQIRELERELLARDEPLSDLEADMFRRRLQDASERDRLIRLELDAREEMIDCERDSLNDAANIATELERVLDDATNGDDDA